MTTSSPVISSSLMETGIWRPSLPESSDGQPLATKVSELFYDFPYERLPENGIVALMTRPEVVLGTIAFYLVVSKPLVKAFRDAIELDPKSPAFRNIVAVHNLALAIFSFVCAYNSWPLAVQDMMERGFMGTLCDADGSAWRESGIGAWVTIFYLSKFYEFVDTWILILKGKDASFLQVYHHTGVVLGFWMGVLSQSAYLMVILLLNSVIHTLMYTYFFIKTVSPKTEIKAARYLTMAQIAQFFTAIASTSGVLIQGETCDSSSSRFSLAFLHLYGYGLIALFTAFAKRKYKKN